MKQTTISINCPKGGVGKSTLSKEICFAYSKTTIDNKKLNVCLIDGNMCFGNINALLRMQPSITILNWAKEISKKPFDINDTVQWEDIEQYFIKHSDGFYVLSAPTTSEESIYIEYKIMKYIIRVVKQFFDVIIIDTGNNTNEYTIASLEESDVVLMIVTDETTTLNSVLSLCKSLNAIDFSMNKVKFILNNYYKEKRMQSFSVRDIEEVLGDKIYSIIPHYEKISALNNSGIACVLSSDNDFKKAILDLAKKITPTFNKTPFNSNH